MLATTYGDPRVRPGSDEVQAHLLATALVDDGVRHVLDASGLPKPPDPLPADVASAATQTVSRVGRWSVMAQRSRAIVAAGCRPCVTSLGGSC